MSTKIVTMTVTETTSSVPTESKYACNLQVMKTKNGLLKLSEVILGIILIVIFFQEGQVMDWPLTYTLITFFLCVVSTLLTAFLLLLSYLISPMAAGIIPKLFFELLYNVYSFLYYTCVSLALLIVLSKGDWDDDKMTKKVIALTVLGFGNGALYFTSSYYGYHSFKSS